MNNSNLPDGQGMQDIDGTPDIVDQWVNFSGIHGGKVSRSLSDRVERRRKSDWITRGITAVTVIGWLCAVLSVVLLEMARPDGEGFFAGLFNVTDVSRWDISMIMLAYTAIMLSLFTSVTGLIFNTVRLRRRADRYNKLLIVLCGISAVLVLLFLLNYARYF